MNLALISFACMASYAVSAEAIPSQEEANFGRPKETDFGKPKATNFGEGKGTKFGQGKETNFGQGKETKFGQGKGTNFGQGQAKFGEGGFESGKDKPGFGTESADKPTETLSATTTSTVADTVASKDLEAGGNSVSASMLIGVLILATVTSILF